MLPTRKEVGDRLKAGLDVIAMCVFFTAIIGGLLFCAGVAVYHIVSWFGLWLIYGAFGLVAFLLCAYSLGQVALTRGWRQTKEQKQAEAMKQRTPHHLDYDPPPRRSGLQHDYVTHSVDTGPR